MTLDNQLITNLNHGKVTSLSFALNKDRHWKIKSINNREPDSYLLTVKFKEENRFLSIGLISEVHEFQLLEIELKPVM